MGGVLFLGLTHEQIHRAEQVIGVVAAALVIAAAARWPVAAIGFVIVFLPLQLVTLAYLYKLGLPATVVRDLGYLKDAATAGVCLAVVVKVSQGRRLKLDALDVFAIGYAGITTAYLLLPRFFPGVLGGNSMSVRLNAWRLDTIFVVLMFAARRIDLLPKTVRRLQATLFLVAIPNIAAAIWETVDRGGYDRFLILNVNLPQYQREILRVAVPDNYITLSAGGSGVRAGGLLVDPLGLGFYMVIVMGVAAILLGGHRLRLLPLIGLTGGAAAVAMTQTRSGLVSAAVAIALSAWLAYRLVAPNRIRAVAIMAAGLLAVGPFVAQGSLVHRFEGIFTASTPTYGGIDDAEHKQRTLSALNDVIHHPVGKGLGANPATGQRNLTSNLTYTENAYLQIGTEVGAAAMLLFVGMYLALLVRLRRVANLGGEFGSLAGGCWLAGCALFVGGFFLPVWLSLPVSMTFWGLAGLAAGVPVVDSPPDRLRPAKTEPGQVQVAPSSWV